MLQRKLQSQLHSKLAQLAIFKQWDPPTHCWGHPGSNSVVSFKEILSTPIALSNGFAPAAPSSVFDPPNAGKHKGSPAISFARKHISALSQHFQWALIGKFSQGYNKTHPNLGRPPVEILQKHFETLDLRGEFQIGLMDNRHLLIQFKLQEDFIRMYSRPVWYIRGMPIRIFKWASDFHVDRESSLVPVWISLPRLPVHFFESNALFAIASLIGMPLRMDSATASLKRPNIARLQVELDVVKEHP